MLNPARIRTSHLPTIIAEGRRTLTALATPCTCGRNDCTLGEHLWHATRDATDTGTRAQAFDQNRTNGTPTNPIPTIDRHTAGAHDNYRRHLATLANTLRELDLLAGIWRPDRGATIDTVTDDDWCRHHLDTIGVCEPRWRGDLCRRCYLFQLAENSALPTSDILEAWRHGRRVTAAMVNDARRRGPNRRKKKKGKKK